MSAAIQQAAISYFGLPEGTWCLPSPVPGTFAFQIPLTEEHLRGIADRMKALAEPVEQVVFAPSQIKTRDQLRDEYNAMPAKEKANWGSFGRYEAHSAMGMAADDAIEPSPAARVATIFKAGEEAGSLAEFVNATEGAGGRKVQHVDAPEDDAGDALPDAVWVPALELTASQILMASDTNAGKCLMQVAMLTSEQRAKYAKGGA